MKLPRAWTRIAGVFGFVFFGGAVSSVFAASAASPELVLYTYDSFVAPGGLGPAILPLFEKRCGCRVRALPCGDGGQILSRLQLDQERKKITAHLVVGIDQYLWEKAKPWLEGWGKEAPRGYSDVIAEARVEAGFLPFDYGILAFMVDRQALTALKKNGLQPPARLRDLLDPHWNRNFILENPKTSTPGLAFLLYTKAILGEKVWDFWASLWGRWLALSPGWDGAYGLFTRGEAPLVWSYTTSQAWHREHGDRGPNPRYSTVIFEEGNPVQVEGAALVKGVPDSERRLAFQFLEFLLSDEVQSRIALHNWMLPVTKKGAQSLPDSFRELPRPGKLLNPRMSAGEVDALLSRWSQVH